jgi:hypothetical protein
MLGKLAWLKVITENRRTIFKLTIEAIFGRRPKPRNPNIESPYAEVPAQEVQGEASA